MTYISRVKNYKNVFAYITEYKEICNIPFDATVVIKIPTVARIKGEGSPTADKHSCFIKFITSGRNL
jgi:hypothetical protein